MQIENPVTVELRFEPEPFDRKITMWVKITDETGQHLLPNSYVFDGYVFGDEIGAQVVRDLVRARCASVS